MRAVSTKNSKAAGEKAADAEQTSKFKMVFNNAQSEIVPVKVQQFEMRLY